jgi:hypothetical protein
MDGFAKIVRVPFKIEKAIFFTCSHFGNSLASCKEELSAKGEGGTVEILWILN